MADDDLATQARRANKDANVGWAIEFNIGGVACRSMTMETFGEAAAVRTPIENNDEVNSVEVVRVD